MDLLWGYDEWHGWQKIGGVPQHTFSYGSLNLNHAGKRVSQIQNTSIGQLYIPRCTLHATPAPSHLLELHGSEYLPQVGPPIHSWRTFLLNLGQLKAKVSSHRHLNGVTATYTSISDGHHQLDIAFNGLTQLECAEHTWHILAVLASYL